MRMIKGIVINVNEFGVVYSDDSIEEIAKLINLYAIIKDFRSIRDNLDILADAEVVCTGWGGIQFDEKVLGIAKNLKVVLYGGGSIRAVVTKSFWEHDIIISSASGANAVPVAQYTLSQILACLKGIWRYARAMQLQRRFLGREVFVVPGGYNSTVGLISLGMIGQKVCSYLQDMDDIKVIAYDPYIDKQQAEALGVEMCSLEEVFSSSDVISVHAPLLEETKGMIGEKLFASMKPNSSFINTARGAVVREQEMIKILKSRQDITAILDVTDPEPPMHDSPLYGMSNVVLTPHISGSLQEECKRHGKYMVDELRRYVMGQPLKWAIKHEEFAFRA